ncbi:MAG: hypothetical protein J6O23_03145 [Prevotella sp.]|nr:hypothetical protein [Prevotella sp.]
MGTTDIALERMFQQIITGNAGLAIAEAETYLAAWPNPQTAEKLRAIKDEYLLMVSYWTKGVRDPQLEQQYQRLLQRVYVLCANIAVFRHIKASSYLSMLHINARKPGYRWAMDDIRRELEGFVSDVALLELEPEEQRKQKSRDTYRRHQQYVNALFNYILTSHAWTGGTGEAMQELLLAPTVDSTDQQLLVSAVALSLMNRFDMVKFRLLTNVYRLSADEQVRQRALVGWVLGSDDDFIGVYPEQRTLVADMLRDEAVCSELTELQMQLVYTLNAEKDTTTITKEIMPDLIKNNNFRITRNGLEEIPEDPLEDVLNPDASEQRMERLESSFQRMIDMQKQGADIYFGGFSQMKRFPFFYDISNWLVPFYMQHPDISEFVERAGSSTMLEKMLRRGSFCDSDKYSFVMAFQQVLNHLPDKFKQMVNSGEAMLGNEIEPEELQSATFMRRSYLMDLYRFFRLFPNRSALCNPFDTTKSELGFCLFFTSALFSGTPLEAYKPKVTAMLKKQRLNASATLLLDSFPETMHDAQYYLWRGDYAAALRLEPDNERALAGHARELFKAGRHGEAEACYDRLQLLHPKTGYVLNKAVCLVQMEEYEEALRWLYQLNYEHEDDDNVTRVLAWALTCSGKLEQAAKYYSQLTAADTATAEDYQNQGCCLWLMERISDAADSLHKYAELSGVSADSPHFLDTDWLQRRGISDTDIKMMTALVASL